MRLVTGLMLMVLLWASPLLLGAGSAAAFTPAKPAAEPLLRDAKIVCGDFGNGYTCRREGGAIRRGKSMKVPGAGSSSSDSGSGGGWFGGGSDNPDALPPASGDTGTANQAPRATAAGCPESSELLGGHCIPYTQSCRTGLAANAAPQACQAAEAKLVCDFRSDGLKDCCCRTYSKY